MVKTISSRFVRTIQQWPFGATVARYFPVVKALGSSPRMVDLLFCFFPLITSGIFCFSLFYSTNNFCSDSSLSF